MKILEKKIKHHYVWAHYLREWTVDKNNVYYVTKKGNVASDSVRGLGLENDFYKMGTLREDDREIILLITKNCNSVLKKIHINFAEMIFSAQKLIAIMSPKFQDKLGVDLNDLMSSNLFEDYLSRQESRAVDILNCLKNGDIAQLESKEIYYEFCYFLGYQFSRTRKMKKLLMLSLHTNESPTNARMRLEDFYDRNWWFMCSFIATNISFDMSLNTDRKVIIIDNNTSIDFITSDQPVINLNPKGHTDECVDYYYPLSPRKALLILTSGNVYFDYDEISSQAVNMLNSKIAYNSCSTIFAKRREEIFLSMDDFKLRHYRQFEKRF